MSYPDENFRTPAAAYPTNRFGETIPPSLPQVFYPWRRYFARLTDWGIYDLAFRAVFVLVFRINVLEQGIGVQLLGGIATLAMTYALEPLLLAKFGTTFGKWLFGMRVQDAAGRNLCYGDALARTHAMLWQGCGFNIPIYSLFRLWNSYKTCSQNTPLPWDEDLSYTIKDTRAVRGVAFVAVQGVQIAALVLLGFSLLYPPNRGALTVAEFAENYNYYVNYIQSEGTPDTLAPDGSWNERPYDASTVTIHMFGEQGLPTYEFICNEAGEIQEVHCTAIATDYFAMPPDYQLEQIATAFALLYARQPIALNCQTVWNNYLRTLQDSYAQGFAFSALGVEITWEVETEGYEVLGLSGYPTPEQEENRYTLTGQIILQ